MATGSVEVVYRGVFQKNLAKNLCRDIVFGARRQGKIGIAFGRYSDSPERNGIPAKQFAVVADTEEEMEEYLSRYEPDNNDVTIVADDTLCKGLESWAWSGLQPVNHLLKPGGTLLVVSSRSPNSLIRDIHRKGVAYNLAILKGTASFSGMWVYRDDHSDARLLGALARIAPEIVPLESVLATLNAAKGASAQQAYGELAISGVAAEQGNDAVPYSFPMPGWREMEECLVVRGRDVEQKVAGMEGGYVPGRNPHFNKFATRTMRPVVNFDTCNKCRICWLQCPDESFDLTPDGYYDPNMEACSGCGICESVCPVKDCISMVNEEAFTDNHSQWRLWSNDPASYAGWRDERTAALPPRSHGFHHVGQYAEEIANERR
jgi:pyruvate ferredoxin oxidoreductase delta subunit